MRIDEIRLEGFRNYISASASFSPDINVIRGRNAQGKTNLLEAVYLLSGLRSFRARRDRELINFNCEQAAIRGIVFAGGRDSALELLISPQGRKRVTIDGAVKKSASELSYRLNTVLFRPEDLEIVRGAAALRRRFMDLAICQLRPRYAAALSEYGKLYQHKIRILRDRRQKPSLLNVLDDFNTRLSKVGAELAYYRSAWCVKLAESAALTHYEISGVGERLEIEYKLAGKYDNTADLKPSALYALLSEHQRELKEDEIEASLCLSGVHKDEIFITIDGKSAKEFASQGQTRTCALSLKLSEREICRSDRGEYPVLLLDDVLSELDPVRQDFVLNKITGGQVLISCCDPGDVERKTGGKIITVENGRIY